METMQNFINAMNSSMKDQRAKYHLTLGTMIEKLKTLPKESRVIVDFNTRTIGNAMSYRGYYSDLSFDTVGDVVITVKEFLELCEESLGDTFTGYKGGDFYMDENTPLWIAEYGSCGRAIVDLRHERDVLYIVTKEIK